MNLSWKKRLHFILQLMKNLICANQSMTFHFTYAAEATHWHWYQQLISTTSYKKISKELETLHQSVVSKCNLLWHLSHLPKSREIIKNTLGVSLIEPTKVRWNSFYDYWKIFWSIPIHKRMPIWSIRCLKTWVKIKYSQPTISYIYNVLSPIAAGLDIL